jgi:hypothetical protein
MSEVSGLQHSAAMLPVGMMSMMGEPPPASTEIQPDEVRFRRLRGAHEIHHIQHLRDQIALPAAALADAGFALREKKEMTSASSAPSSGSGSTSVPSGTSL